MDTGFCKGGDVRFSKNIRFLQWLTFCKNLIQNVTIEKLIIKIHFFADLWVLIPESY